MIILLLVLAIVATIIATSIFKRKGEEFWLCFSVAIGISVIISIIILTCCYLDEVMAGKFIDEKIAMYQEENTKIEEQIDALVRNYMKYESNTFAEFKGDDSVLVVSLYPELKSDALVQNQISVYTENNKKIKELKEQKIEAAKSKWWLYFGK